MMAIVAPLGLNAYRRGLIAAGAILLLRNLCAERVGDELGDYSHEA